jgi:hypothetical protein
MTFSKNCQLEILYLQHRPPENHYPSERDPRRNRRGYGCSETRSGKEDEWDPKGVKQTLFLTLRNPTLKGQEVTLIGFPPFRSAMNVVRSSKGGSG